MAFDAGAIEARLTLDRSDFATGMRQAQLEADRLDGKKIEVELDLETGFNTFAALQAEIAAMDGQRINIDVDVDSAAADLAALQAQVLALDRQRIEIDVDVDSAPLAALGSTAASSSGHLMGLVKIAAMVAPVLVPALAGAAAGGVALAGALGGAAVAGGVLALGIIPVAKEMSTAKEEITKAKDKLKEMEKGSAEYAEQAKIVADLQKEFNATFGPAAKGMENLTGAWTRFKDATRDASIGLIAQGLNLVASILPKLVPVFDAVAAVASRALTKLQGFANGSGMDRFVNYILTVGVPAFESFLNILGNLALGFGRMLDAFGPFTNEFMGGFEGMTARFAEWAGTLKNSTAFQEFINYVRESGPQLLSVLGSVIDALVNLGVALAPLSGPFLAVVGAVASFIAAVPPGVLTAIAVGFYAVSFAMKAVAVGTAIFYGIAKAIAAVKLAWATLSAFFLASNPLGWAIAAAIALGIALVVLWKKSETFRNIVTGAWNKIKEVAGAVAAWFTSTVVPAFVNAWNRIKEVFNQLKSAISAGEWSKIPGIIATALGDATQWLIQKGKDAVAGLLTGIKNKAIELAQWWLDMRPRVIGWVGDASQWLFEKGKQVLGGLLSGMVAKGVEVGTWLAGLPGRVKGWVGDAVTWLRTKGFDVITGLLAGIIERAASVGTWLATNLPGLIKSAVTNAPQWLMETGPKIIGGLIKGIVNNAPKIGLAMAAIPLIIIAALAAIPILLIAIGASFIFGLIKGIVGAIPGLGGAMSGAKNLIVGQVRGTWSLVTSLTSGAWNGIRGIISGSLSAIGGIVSGGVSRVRGLVSGAWSAIRALTSAAWAGIRGAISAAWSSIGGTVSGGVSRVRGLVSAGWSAVRGATSSAWSSIRSAISSAWSAIRGVVSGAMSSVRGTISSGWSAVRGATSAAWSAIRSLISGAMSAVRSVVSGAMSSIRGVVSSGMSAVRSAFSSGMSSARSAVSGGMSAIASAVSGGISRVVGVMASLPGRILGALGDLGGLLRGAGARLIGGLVDGIQSQIGRVRDAMGSVAGMIGGFLPGSPVKYGPLRSWNRGGAGVRLARMLAQGLEVGTRDVARAADRMASTIAPGGVDVNRNATVGGGGGGAALGSRSGRSLTVQIGQVIANQGTTEDALFEQFRRLELVYGE